MPSRSGTSIVLFTRDLRVHDHPALVAAAGSRRLLAVLVFDDTILSRPYAAPNRLRILIDSLTDLRRALRDLGSELIITRGRPADVVRDLVRRRGVDAIHCSADVSAFARRREAALAQVAAGVPPAEFAPAPPHPQPPMPPPPPSKASPPSKTVAAAAPTEPRSSLS